MDEDTVNDEVRSFLKQFGVTSQRELETAVRDAVEAGTLESDETLAVSATLHVEELELEHVIDGTIALE